MIKNLISIIVPVFNAEDYLERAVTSVLVQDYKDVEVLLVDNGSTDKSKSICDKLSKEDHRIRVFEQYQKGAHSARLKGFIESRGEFLVFLDADDVLASGALRTLFNEISEGVDLVVGRECRFDNTGKIYETDTQSYLPEVVDQKEYIRLMYMNQIAPYLHGVIYRKKLFNESVFYQCINNNVVIGEDWISNLLISEYLRSAKIIADVVYFYYINEGSTMSSSVLGWENGIRCSKALAPFMEKASLDIIELSEFKSAAGCLRNFFIPELGFNWDAYKTVLSYIHQERNLLEMKKSLPGRYFYFIDCSFLFYIYTRIYTFCFKWFKLKGKVRKVV